MPPKITRKDAQAGSQQAKAELKFATRGTKIGDMKVGGVKANARAVVTGKFNKKLSDGQGEGPGAKPVPGLTKKMTAGERAKVGLKTAAMIVSPGTQIANSFTRGVKASVDARKK